MPAKVFEGDHLTATEACNRFGAFVAFLAEFADVAVQAVGLVFVGSELLIGQARLASGADEALSMVRFVTVGYAATLDRLPAFDALAGDVSLEAVFAVDSAIFLDEAFGSDAATARRAFEAGLVVLEAAVLHATSASLELLSAFVTLGGELVVIATDADEFSVTVGEAGIGQWVLTDGAGEAEFVVVAVFVRHIPAVSSNDLPASFTPAAEVGFKAVHAVLVGILQEILFSCE